MQFGLSDRAIKTLNSIFLKYPNIIQVILYGSRAKGNYKNGSDIDITLKVDESFTHTNLSRIWNDFDDSDLPYFVDVSIYDNLSCSDLKRHIDRVGKIIFPQE